MRQRIHRPDWGQGTLLFGRQLAGRFYCGSGTVWMFLFRCRTAVCVIVCFFYLSLICPRFNLWCPFHSKDLIILNTFVYLTIILNFQLSNSWTSFDQKKMRSTCHSRIGHFGNSVVGQQNIPIPSCQIAVNELYTNSNKTQLMSNYITFERSYLVSAYSF